MLKLWSLYAPSTSSEHARIADSTCRMHAPAVSLFCRISTPAQRTHAKRIGVWWCGEGHLLPVFVRGGTELADAVKKLVMLCHELLAVLLHAGRQHARTVHGLVIIFKVLVGEHGRLGRRAPVL